MKKHLDYLQALKNHHGDRTVSELRMADLKEMGLKHEALNREDQWQRSEPFYKYLLIRHSQSQKNKNSSAQYMNNQGFPPLTSEHLNFLYDWALSIADSKQNQMKTRYGYNELTMTEKERTLLRHIESILELEPVRHRSKGIQVFPRISTRDNKLILGPVIPDLVFLGLTPPKGTSGRGFSNKSKKIKWIGTAIEVDGPIHDWKPEKDVVGEKILEEMGIYTIRIRNEDFDTWAITQSHIREQILQFKDSRASYMRQSVMDDFLIKVKLLTIATYLGPRLCDGVCSFANLPSLQILEGIEALAKSKKCPRWLRRYSKSL